MPKIGSPHISVVIPAYNEEVVIVHTINDIMKALAPYENYEIIVVDDGSIDNTARIAEIAGAKVIRHERNLGYGKALVTGLKHAKGDVIVIVEPGLAFSPLDIEKLVKELEKADLVIGSKFLEPRIRVGLPFYKVLLNKIRALITYFLTGVKVTDHYSNLIAIRKEKFDQLHLTSSNFSIKPEMVVKAAKKGFKISEIPVMRQELRRS